MLHLTSFLMINSITTSWEAGKAKPHQDIFVAAARSLGVAPHETLVVGDDLDEDYNGAREAGLQSLLLHRTRHDADYVRRNIDKNELRDIEVITDLAQLPAWLNRHGPSKA